MLSFDSINSNNVVDREWISNVNIIKIHTMRATNNVLNGSSVHVGIVFGSHIAISRSNLYATCSAFSLRRRSKRSSRVSTLVGGGVSPGS